jgi:NADH-quinone oxidoreductase subunit H
LGAIRSISQLISYEVCLSLSVLPIFFWIGSFDLFLIVEKQGSYWFYNVFPLSFFIFFVSALAELNRTPFDLTEAESELVSGYNVEYGSSGFVLFYIAEYLNIVLYSAFISIFFFGG